MNRTKEKHRENYQYMLDHIDSSVEDICKDLGICKSTYYNIRKKFITETKPTKSKKKIASISAGNLSIDLPKGIVSVTNIKQEESNICEYGLVDCPSVTGIPVCVSNCSIKLLSHLTDYHFVEFSKLTYINEPYNDNRANEQE